jgi:hypothetical protein
MGAAEVWLLGGPADGRLQLVESDEGGALPQVLVLPQAGFYLGCDDDAAPGVDHLYQRVDDVDGRPVYQYQGARPSPPFS